jgi:uncharacterized protein (DUF2141 family)
MVLMFFGTAFLWRCANIAAPQGGDRDTLPPVVVSATPDFGTVNFDARRIYIAFNEYPQLKDLSREFFTSPRMKRTPTVTVRGRGIQIDIRDTLSENITYVLNFGSAVADNNEGNVLHGFSYVFSTGPEVDSLMMSGYVVNAQTNDSIPKALILFFDAAADSLAKDSTLFKSVPLAVARAEANALFLARHLQPRDYRVYAIQDENGNFQYDAGVDKVAFLDGTYNPADMIDFDVKFDTLGMIFAPQPQLFFKVFTDATFRRQVMTGATRPLQHKVQLTFGAPFPQVDSLILDGILPERIITEYPTRGRDTINLWLDVPSELLPDTITGRITYMRHDSINNLVPYGDKLSLVWRHIETAAEKRQRERLERERERAFAAGEEFVEEPEPTLFGYDFKPPAELNPEHAVSILFHTPATRIDSARIALLRLGEDGNRYRVRHRLWQDTLEMRRWNISAPWAEGEKYRLEIPDGVFTDIAGHLNDSITGEFNIMSADKFGSLTLEVRGKTPRSLYVLTLLDSSGKAVEEKKFVTSGRYTFRFLRAGEYRLRILEDMNGNGEWDTGNVVERRQPERIEIFTTDTGAQNITIRVGWEVDNVIVDMNEIFAPISIESVRQRVQRAEETRLRKLEDEIRRRREQEAARMRR